VRWRQFHRHVPAGDQHLRRLLAAGLLLAAPAAAEPLLLVPLEGPACISSPFGPRGGALHAGVDLPAPAGAWVRAAAPGRVTAIRRMGAAGLTVELHHADGSRTRYAHLGTLTPALAGGRATVALGERLGRVGRTGTTRGTHLHFELLRQGQRIDPAPALGLVSCGVQGPP
jgi:murein DD-endopeptidase MepM/ murein hydrolase activator NlpD